ncbi:hypothetical protein [Streptomyces gilvosporeus]|uniref:Uncharacterized protein n=1 Tax=Streptomyces gilvosporeus TaxID=553510 RepID=A0A1V0U025_9ACTN|nr:hypothetical protein [Streptomyces gilvosporeus]ARF58511.1 hypothetical protein B1H19_33845 [Streptomyces gilvosporeus]
MTRTVQQVQRSVRARRAAAGSAAAVAAGLALVVGAAGTGQAAALPTESGAQSPSAASCGAATAAPKATAAARTAPVPEAAPAPGITGNAAQKISYGLGTEAPVGLWTSSSVTLRTPVSQGTVSLDVTTRGFSAASLEIQRYVPTTHRWVDLDSSVGGGLPDKGTFTFPVSVAASSGHPASVALRVKDLDRPGRLSVAASVKDGHGHTYRAPVRNAVVDQPTTTLSGWSGGTALVRGGAAKEFTLKVKNTTRRAYPALNAGYFAYGQSNGHTLAPKDLKLQQYVPGRGWQRVSLLPGGCDPGMSAALIPTAKSPLAPGATAVYRMRLAVAGSAPATKVEAGVSAGTGDTSFFYRTLPFVIRAR